MSVHLEIAGENVVSKDCSNFDDLLGVGVCGWKDMTQSAINGVFAIK